MAIEGRLSEMDLPTLVQYACNEGQRAKLILRHDEDLAELYFDGGNLVHATCEDQKGEEVFYRVLRWEEGQFTLESSVEPPARTIDVPWSMLLVDGLQRYDEESWDAVDYHEEEFEMPENIQDILTELAEQLPGFVATSVVGMDGLGIADHAAAGVDTEAINAQMALLVKLVDTTVTKLTNDEVDDYLLTTDHSYLLVRFLEDKEYFLGIAADRNTAKLGNLRLNSRIYSQRVDKALPR
jgi:predicted regulator of Ras-like GTPase activity (Roadblock/LC7/MglB family)